MSDLTRLNPTPHAIAVYASQPLSPVATQHSLPSRTLPFTWAGLSPAGSHQLCLAHSFDHLVGTHEQGSRHGQAESLGRLEVDEQLDFRGLLNRKVDGLLALENPASVDAALNVPVNNAASIAQQAASGSELTQLVHRRQRVTHRQIGDLVDLTVEENIGTDHEAGRLQPGRGSKHCIELWRA